VEKTELLVGGGDVMETIFPPCPKCKEGHLVPFSMGHDVFELWKCTNCDKKVLKKE